LFDGVKQARCIDAHFVSFVVLTKKYYGDLPHGFLAAEAGDKFYVVA